MIGREHGKSIFERICSNELERHWFEEKDLNLLTQRDGCVFWFPPKQEKNGSSALSAFVDLPLSAA